MGFQNVIASTFIGRYKINEIIIDVMSIDENVLGFSNKWYKEGIEKSFLLEIDKNISVCLMPFHYFIVSKIEAHYSRNKGDLRQSKGFEDIVYSFDNRLNPLVDMQKATGEVEIYLKQKIDEFLENTNFHEGIHSHLNSGNASSRLRRIKGIWSAFVSG